MDWQIFLRIIEVIASVMIIYGVKDFIIDYLEIATDKKRNEISKTFNGWLISILVIILLLLIFIILNLSFSKLNYLNYNINYYSK